MYKLLFDISSKYQNKNYYILLILKNLFEKNDYYMNLNEFSGVQCIPNQFNMVFYIPINLT